jgi:TPR repeat protein
MAFGIGVAGPALALDLKGVNPDTPPADALRAGLNAIKGGDMPAALQALNFAADKGLVSASWKLGEMYATGDGVERNDYRAFQLFSGIANTHADDSPREATAPYVSSAFIRLAGYFRTGIAGSPVRADMARARQYFMYAASYFGDASAQLGLARMLYYGEGGAPDAIQAARWANLSADKGNADAKSLLIVISLDVANKHLEGVPSPYDVRRRSGRSARPTTAALTARRCTASCCSTATAYRASRWTG